jgi:hypothetical protein
VSGANTVTLTQGNLPNVSFTGSAASAGNHTHDTDPASFNSSTAGNHDHWVDPPNTGTSIDGSHTHSSNANGGYGAGNLGLVYSDGFTTASSVDFSWFELNLGAMPQPLVIYDNGNHWHNVDIAGFASSINGNHLHAVDVPSTTSTTNGAHTHSVSVSSGGSATPVNIAPQSLSVNMFIYLGN